MAIVLVCVVLAITPFAVLWNYRQSIKDGHIPIEYVMSIITHEYITTSYYRNDYDN